MSTNDYRYACIVKLDGCHHRPKFTMSPPLKGDELFCIWCRTGRRVTLVEPAYWEAKCRTCEWHKSTGSVMGQSLSNANNHSTKQNHIVEVWSMDKRLYKTVFPLGEQLTLSEEWTGAL